MIKSAIKSVQGFRDRVLSNSGCCCVADSPMDKDENVGVVTRNKAKNLETQDGFKVTHHGVKVTQHGVKVMEKGDKKGAAVSRRSFPMDNRSNEPMEASPSKQRRLLVVRDGNILEIPKPGKFDGNLREENPLPGCGQLGVCPNAPGRFPRYSVPCRSPPKSKKKKKRDSKTNDSAYISHLHSLPDFWYEKRCSSDFPPGRALAPPPFIKNIDADPDSVTSNLYAASIHDYIMKVESEHTIPADFLAKSPEVTTRMRSVLMDWLLQVQHHEDMSDDTLHLTVHLVDEVLSRRTITMTRLQLIGITCFLIAAKFTERFAPGIGVLCYLTEDTFTKDEVIACELDILWLIGFKLTRPVSPSFLDRFLQVHTHTEELEDLAHYILDLTITSADLVTSVPSKKAAGSLYVARWVLLDHEDLWDENLAYYSTYSKEMLADVVKVIVTLLYRAPQSKYQGALNKWTQESKGPITGHERLEPRYIQERMRMTDIDSHDEGISNMSGSSGVSSLSSYSSASSLSSLNNSLTLDMLA